MTMRNAQAFILFIVQFIYILIPHLDRACILVL